MNKTVAEWVAKAEGDFRTANRELGAKDAPNWDAVCFHAQQCVEKLMKALLIANGVVPPRTNELIRLDELLRPVVPEWAPAIDDLRALSLAAVAFRYPGESADRDDALQSVEVCARFRDSLLSLLT